MVYNEAVSAPTAFDDLIEGNFEAQQSGAVKLGVPAKIVIYRLKAGFNDQVAAFYEPESFTAFSGGFQTVADFNDAMKKRRESFAAGKARKLQRQAVEQTSAFPTGGSLTAEEAVELDLVRAGEGDADDDE